MKKLLAKGQNNEITTFCPVCFSPVMLRNKRIMKFLRVKNGLVCDECWHKALDNSVL